MSEETKQAMDDGYDMIVELVEFIKDSELRASCGDLAPSGETREILNKAQGVLDGINDELYKTL